MLEQLTECIGPGARHEALLGALVLSDSEIDLALDLYFDASRRQACVIAGVMVSESAAALLPDGWETAISRSTGQMYFVNSYSGESTYDRPTEAALALLPDGWYTDLSTTTGPVSYTHLTLPTKRIV